MRLSAYVREGFERANDCEKSAKITSNYAGNAIISRSLAIINKTSRKIAKKFLNLQSEIQPGKT